MRKYFLFAVALLSATVAYADEIPAVSLPSSVELKQGAIMKWDSQEHNFENLTTFTIARTEPVESFGKWNALWDGWTIDAGFAYDAQTLDTVAVMLGRDFGTLGKYLPIAFPLKDKISFSIYPVGIYADNVLGGGEEGLKVSGASGLAIVKFDVSF